MRAFLLACCSLVFLASCGSGESSSSSSASQAATPKQATTLSSKSTMESKEPATETMSETLQPEQLGIVPERIIIPAIDVDAPIVKEGLNQNGDMEVPDNSVDVGWFEPGTEPGNAGSSVLAGHVDDYTGPAVFFDLKDLEKGDEVIIVGEGGEELTFEVQKVESYPWDDAPIREIFGPTDERRLNLLTCTGLYDKGTNNHQERLAVYTELVTE
ncbi:peptidase C60 [Pontibacillus halophilus JSM 076056 = DSM 19796]|uniref:Peptidase C60 n=1 Tax=Pontibacillus halophilus JSM 076056 = DSM 19796 TaxID=1385510 RepID=A0A0A5IDZ0_9BACI|nr:class F sortase [Pontibacillus halophilus]KGX94027.1 peptidase C60 [Pontibacillus halophilus JSM 076056 = DSM 19796]